MKRVIKRTALAAGLALALAGGLSAQAIDLLPTVSIENTPSRLVWTLDAMPGLDGAVPATVAPRLVRNGRPVRLIPGGNAIPLLVNDWIATGRAPSGVGARPELPPEQAPPVVPWWTFDAFSQVVVTGSDTVELLFGTIRSTGDAPADAAITIGPLRITGEGRATVRRDTRALTITVVSGSVIVRRDGSVVRLLGRDDRWETPLATMGVRDHFAALEEAMFSELNPAIDTIVAGSAIDGDALDRLRHVALAFGAAYAEAEQRRFPWVESPDLLANHLAEALWLPSIVTLGR